MRFTIHGQRESAVYWKSGYVDRGPGVREGEIELRRVECKDGWWHGTPAARIVPAPGEPPMTGRYVMDGVTAALYPELAGLAPVKRDGWKRRIQRAWAGQVWRRPAVGNDDAA